MASRHLSLNMSEVADLTDMVVGFEEHNTCVLEMMMMRVTEVKVPDLLLTLVAWPKEGKSPEVKPLASVSVRCSATNLKTWNSALTHAMYALDFQLALAELGHAEPKRA